MLFSSAVVHLTPEKAQQQTNTPEQVTLQSDAETKGALFSSQLLPKRTAVKNE
jgi:hypothetical protein